MLALIYAPEREFFHETYHMKHTIFRLKNSEIGFLARIIIVIFVIASLAMPHAIKADAGAPEAKITSPTLVKNGRLTICKLDKSSYEVVKTVKMMVTAYSSTPDQTDDTPFITASGKKVTDGIIANNMLPFGTKVRIPELYGEKIFVVQDRMHQRKGRYHADIWFQDHQEAKEFGAKITTLEVVES